MERKIVEALLDKYERSSFFRTGTAPTKRIMLKFYDNGKSEFEDYNIENSEQRMGINDCLKDLAVKGLIHFEWMKGEEDHIASKIWMNLDNLQEAYCFAQRQPQDEMIEGIVGEIVGCMESINSQWMKNYLQDICENVQQKKRLSSLIPADAQERAALLQTLRYIDSNEDGNLLKRIFSIRCFGDSKYFEQVVEKRLLRILKRYLEYDEQTTDEQLLNQIGIVKYPEQIEFRGPIIFRFSNETEMDFSNLNRGCAVYSQDIAAAQIVLSGKTCRILSIENKANYFDYITKSEKRNELVIYHGGQYSPSKKLFLQALANASVGTPWYHWGDIDYGGFSMLARLRREIRSDIYPYRMDKQELLTFSSATSSFSSEYGQKLRDLMMQNGLQDCSECLAYMLECGVRLEQEALLE